MKLAVSIEASLCLGRLWSMFFQMGRLTEWERGRRIWQPRVANKTSFDPTAKYLILPDLMTPSYTNHIHSPNQPTATIIGNTLHAPGVQVSAGLIELASELKHLCRTEVPVNTLLPQLGVRPSFSSLGQAMERTAAWRLLGGVPDLWGSHPALEVQETETFYTNLFGLWGLLSW